MIKKIIFACIALLTVIATSKTVLADTISDEEYYRIQIEEIASDYGYTVTFPSTISNNNSDIFDMSLPTFWIILEDLERATQYTSPIIQNSTNNLFQDNLLDYNNVTYYTKKHSSTFNETALADYYRFSMDATADITYMYFQGYPRFVEAENIHAKCQYFSPLEWNQISTSYNTYTHNQTLIGQPIIELVSYGYFTFSGIIDGIIPFNLTGEYRDVTCSIYINEVINAAK